MLGHNLITKQTSPEGLPVSKLYVTEMLDIANEYYLSLSVSREHFAPVLLMCKGGGTNIEELAARSPEQVVNIPLKYSEGITSDVVSTVCDKLAHGQDKHKEVEDLLTKLFKVFVESDATLLEINPLAQDRKTGSLMCADTKLTIDNAAKFRQKRVFEYRDFSQEKAVELEAEKHGLVYIQLEGTIGCLVNGAGLAMATNDAVAHFGGKCANFLDGGGQATKETMVKAFDLILSDPNVNTILVNIYGGIIRCDMIAQAVIAAAEHVGDIPVVVRLQGTNSAQGQKMIAESGLKLFAEDEFGGSVQKAIELSKQTKRHATGKSASSVGSSVRSYSTLSQVCGRNALNPSNRRSMSTATPAKSYSETVPNLAINKSTRVIYQGFTGKAVSRLSPEPLFSPLDLPLTLPRHRPTHPKP
jgi:succinyl-CoA synthetase beta subunit